MHLSDLCRQARPELAALGEVGAPLVGVVDHIARVGGTRGVDALDDPTFALDLLGAGSGDAPLVGRVLDYLRARRDAGVEGGGAVQGRATITIASAVAEYEAGPFRLLADSSQPNFRTWTRRLVARFGDHDPAAVSAGDLADLVSHHAANPERKRRGARGGKSAVEMGVTAYRHLWLYLVQKRYAEVNVAQELTKPTRAEANRRAIRPDEAALLRAFSRTARDPSLDLVILGLAERAALRRVEICRLRIRDVDFDRDELRIWQKGDKPYRKPITPGLRELLVAYVDDRRPPSVPPDVWRRSEARLLRSRPTAAHPTGCEHGRRKIDEMFQRFRQLAPDVFAEDDVSLHSYRHAVGRWMDKRYGRGYSRAVLGHTSNSSPTDHYTRVPPEELRGPLAEYEAWLLAAGTQEDAGGEPPSGGEQTAAA